MWVKRGRRIFAHSLQPAASPKALTHISREIRSHFYKTQLRPTLKRIDAYLIRWSRRKFKRLRHQTKGAREGSTGYAVPIQHSLLIGRSVMATAEHRGLNSRGSCTVLGAPGGEIPAGDSTFASYRGD